MANGPGAVCGESNAHGGPRMAAECPGPGRLALPYQDTRIRLVTAVSVLTAPDDEHPPPAGRVGYAVGAHGTRHETPTPDGAPQVQPRAKENRHRNAFSRFTPTSRRAGPELQAGAPV